MALSAEGTSSFCIDRFEVTVAAYESCVAAGQCTIPASAPSAGEHWADACNFGRPERAQHPINCVTWAQALQLCHFRGGELPSSEQWILAAGGPGSRYPFPGEPSPLPLNACGSECPEHTGQARDYFGSDPFPMTAPVGSFPGGASVFGVFDLAGNVAEWMSDEVPNAPSMRRIRGGGWLDPPRRVNFAQSQSAAHVGRSVGLRCVTAPSS